MRERRPERLDRELARDDAVAAGPLPEVEKNLRHLGHLAARRVVAPRGGDVRSTATRVAGGVAGGDVVAEGEKPFEEVRRADLFPDGGARERRRGRARGLLEQLDEEVEEDGAVVARERDARGSDAAAVDLREDVPRGDDRAVRRAEEPRGVHAVRRERRVQGEEIGALARADERGDREEADVVRRDERVAPRAAEVRLVHERAVPHDKEAVAAGERLERARGAIEARGGARRGRGGDRPGARARAEMALASGRRSAARKRRGRRRGDVTGDAARARGERDERGEERDPHRARERARARRGRPSQWRAERRLGGIIVGRCYAGADADGGAEIYRTTTRVCGCGAGPRPPRRPLRSSAAPRPPSALRTRHRARVAASAASRPRPPSRANMSFAEPMVATVDDPDGLPESAARTLARRFWILGWFGLPLAWATNAYYFWPHLRDARADADVGLSAEGPADDGANPDVVRVDPVVRRYAMMSLRGAQASAAVLVAWATAFLAGGERAFGEELWRTLSVTAQPS